MIREILDRIKRDRRPDSLETFVVIGLGNPGPRYANTRHNIGFMVTDDLVGKLPTGARYDRWASKVEEIRHDGRNIIVAQPLTFMNRSGIAVSQISRNLHVPPCRILVIYDELDLAFGTIRLGPGGGSGGHNGMASVIESLGTSQFPRLRVGIGRPTQGNTVDFLLSVFTVAEQELIAKIVDLASDAALAWLELGIDNAMNAYNRRTLRECDRGERLGDTKQSEH